MVQLYLSGKSAQEITEAYDLSPASIHTWVKQFNNTNTFKETDNLTEDQRELIKQENVLKN